MARDPMSERIRSMCLFRGADKSALESLAHAADDIEVDAGHVLTEQGRHHHAIYVLQSGAASVAINGKVVAELSTDDLVGELSYFNHSAASATVTTTEPSRVLTIPFNRFEQILEGNPMLVRAIVAELAERLEATDLQLKELTSEISDAQKG